MNTVNQVVMSTKKSGHLFSLHCVSDEQLCLESEAMAGNFIEGNFLELCNTIISIVYVATLIFIANGRTPPRRWVTHIVSMSEGNTSRMPINVCKNVDDARHECVFFFYSLGSYL